MTDLPSLDFWKPHGHDGPHHPVRNNCPASMTVAKMADLPLDCRLTPGHELPHIDSATGARWLP